MTEQTARVMPAEFVDRVSGATPLGRVGRPEDTAHVIAFFASDESGF